MFAQNAYSKHVMNEKKLPLAIAWLWFKIFTKIGSKAEVILA